MNLLTFEKNEVNINQHMWLFVHIFVQFIAYSSSCLLLDASGFLRGKKKNHTDDVEVSKTHVSDELRLELQG